MCVQDWELGFSHAELGGDEIAEVEMEGGEPADGDGAAAAELPPVRESSLEEPSGARHVYMYM